MILAHVIIALASLALTGYVFVRPSQNKLYISYAFVAATLVTGFSLVLSKPSHMVQSCVMGLVYLALVSYGIVAARNKLGHLRIK